jgi:hypothetical protein
MDLLLVDDARLTPQRARLGGQNSPAVVGPYGEPATV